MKVKTGIAARHVHLSRADLDKLFGEGYELTKYKDISQTGQYAANEKVTIKTEDGSFENVRILGPIRSQTQIEISKTDSYKLKLNPPVRNSGDLSNSEPISIIGPEGAIELKEGCIIATRHIHVNTEEAEKAGFYKGQIVKVKVSGEKGGTLDNVYIKINPLFVFEFHIDLDDANANLIKNGDEVEIVK